MKLKSTHLATKLSDAVGHSESSRRSASASWAGLAVHDKSIPREAFLFAPVTDAYGKRLALVFGNEFNQGTCPFYRKQCIHCDIGAGEGFQASYEVNSRRLDFFSQHYSRVLPDVVHLVVYNSGSTLNCREMSRSTLKAILDFCCSMERAEILSFESRESYIREENLEFLVANLRNDQCVRVVLGVESQSDHVRIGNLKKQMTKRSIETSFSEVGKFKDRLGIAVNIIFQPPRLLREWAISEALHTVLFCLELSRRHHVSVDFNIHPYYPSKKSVETFPMHPRANLADLLRAVILMGRSIEGGENDSKIFIGWQDEMHDQEQDKREQELRHYWDIFDRFNVDQDWRYLDRQCFPPIGERDIPGLS